MNETFWMLMRDRAHWEFEMFLMLIFDGILAGMWKLYRRWRQKHRPVHSVLETPRGLCEGCGGTVKHLIESGIEWCLGCGHIKVAKEFTASESKIQTKE